LPRLPAGLQVVLSSGEDAVRAALPNADIHLTLEVSPEGCEPAGGDALVSLKPFEILIRNLNPKSKIQTKSQNNLEPWTLNLEA